MRTDIAPKRDLSDPTPWRASARASLARRAAQAVHARRIRRSRRATVAVALALGCGTSGALASTASAPKADAGIRAVQAALNITADGVSGPQTRRAVRRFQRSKGLTVDGIVGPQTMKALGLVGGKLEDDGAAPARQAASAQRADAGSLLEAIALCESGGDPTAVSGDGTYRGKYQFTRETWRTVGGQGDPAAAPEAEQDQRAQQLLEREGTGPWPACARRIGA